MKLKKINLAEFFALVRIITFPVVLFFILQEARILSAWLYIILFATDGIDGVFAHFFGQESKRRARLDTIGDIAFLLVGLVGLYVFETSFFMEYIGWIGLVLGAYFLQLLLALIRYKQPSNFHSYLAKVAAFFQVVFLSYSFFFGPLEWLFYFTLVLSILDAVEEIILVLLLKDYQINVPGLYWVLGSEKGKKKQNDLL